VSFHPLSRPAKLLAIVVTSFLIGFVSISYFYGLSYCDDRTQLIGNHPIAAESATTNAVANPGARINLQVHFALRHQAALNQLLAQQQNPASPNYHRWVKTGEFFHRFGPTKSEVKALTEWLREERFNVTGVSAGYLEFSGSVEQVQRTFAVKIASFANGYAYANTSDPYIPVRFANVIGAVTGMDNMVHAAPASQHTNGDFDPEAIIGGNQAFGPNDFQTFYDDKPAPGGDGDGDCVAIVGTSDFLDSTMSAFTNQFGLPPISYTRVLHGANPGINGAEVEAELDLQWAHAAAPGSSVVFHLGGYLVDDISGAVNDNQCGTISISYGFCGPSPAFINSVIHPLFQQAAAQGQSVFVSSGDQGAAGLGYDPATNSCVAGNSPSVNEMSADPDVTSVGGTQFKPTFVGGNDQGYISESVWNDVSGAGGGGASQIFSKPDYQIGPGVPNDDARDVPDISMMSSPNSPGAFFGHDMSGNGQVVCCVGGTSLAAPIWAGFSRVLAQVAGQPRLGNLNPIIYQLANQNYAGAGFHDVTIGNNGYNGLPGFNAGPGYDQATGWGTVDFAVFANAVKVLFNPNASPTPTPTAMPTPTATPTPTPQATGGVLGVPGTFSFPATATGKPGIVKALVVRNLSRTSALSVDVGTLAAPFAVTGAGHYVLRPGASTEVAIFFSPASCGTASELLKITSSDPKHSNASVQVSAVVKGGKLTMPSKVALTAALSATATKTVMLKNSGAGMLSGSTQSLGANSPFTIVGGSVSFWLAPGQSQPVTIQFKPATMGKAQGNLMIAMVEPVGTASISISGSAK
jgi:subtilase family serine protease